MKLILITVLAICTIGSVGTFAQSETISLNGHEQGLFLTNSGDSAGTYINFTDHDGKKASIASFDDNFGNSNFQNGFQLFIRDGKHFRIATSTDSSAGTNKFVLFNDGRLGIGTTDPFHKLDVDGNIRAKGNNARIFFGPSNGTTGNIHLIGRAQQNGYHANGSTAGDFVISAQGGENIHFGTHSGVNVHPVSRMVVSSDGRVGIGTTSPTQLLSVNGTIQAKEVIVETGWSDFVFESSYKLKSLEDVEAHIEEFGHLPDVPSAATVESEGLSVGEAQKIMMQKIEELTLYVIEQDKKIAAQQEEIEKLNSR